MASHHRIIPQDEAPSGPAFDGEILRLVRRLEDQSDLRTLLRSALLEFRKFAPGCVLVLGYESADYSSSDAIDSAGSPIAWSLSPGFWASEFHRSTIPQALPLVIQSFEKESRFPLTIAFFRKHGSKSLCVLPLSAKERFEGGLLIGSNRQRAFGKEELSRLTTAAECLAMAITQWHSFADTQTMRAQLENQERRLKLILDLNNSLVSNLDLREVLSSISPGIRKVMHLDGVALMLPDAMSNCLYVQVVDFPGTRGAIQQTNPIPLDTSLPGEVFRSGKAWIGDIQELRESGYDHRIASAEGVETMCLLPLTRCDRVLGVLCLVRQERNAFTSEEIEFLTQIAGQVAIAIDNALAYQKITELSDRLTQEKLYLEDEIRTEMNFEEIIGNSAVLRNVLAQVEAVAPTESAVLIYGETGTGKELIARAVHKLSQRHAHAFVKLNCAAIPTGLLESELFGHEKGAFTGAVSQRIGRFELANDGTIFLDEVGEIPPELQPKLLRVLQEREFERLGSSHTLRSNARLIAATNRDLRTMVEENRFRSDLFYRLNVFPVHVPPLRERMEDIPFLIRHFTQHFARNARKHIDTIPSETMHALIHYAWPGNIRELQNIIERAVILSKGPVLKVPLSDLKLRAGEGVPAGEAVTLQEVERNHILAVLKQTNWVFSGPNGAAARLGMKRPTLQFRMQKLGISRPAKR